MRALALGVVVSALFCANGAGAISVTGEAMQQTWYEFTYFAPDHSIWIEEIDQNGTYEARYTSPGAGETTWWSPGIIFEDGLYPHDLSGRKIEFSGPTYEGFLEFGAANSVIDWNLSSWNSAGESFSSRPAGQVLDLSHDARNILNRDLVQGMMVYDLFSWAPQNETYATQPGRWLISMGHTGSSAEGEVLQAQAAVAQVPLPLSGLALTSGVASLFAARRFRARSAKGAA
jgi:hypothetical protein